VEFNEDDTVSAVKQKLRDSVHIPVGRQVLVRRGHRDLLPDRTRLGRLGIGSRDFLDVMEAGFVVAARRRPGLRRPDRGGRSAHLRPEVATRA
jgi:hypothetical protein